MSHSKDNTDYKQMLGWNVVVAVSYMASAWLFMAVAVPPGYSTPFWPGAGVALTALLMGGPGLSFGIFFGSWMVNFSLEGLSHSSLAGWLNMGWTASGIATGAVLQAFLGRFLVLRFCEKPLLLDRHRSTLNFLFLLAPLSCLVSASMGVSTLILTGKISADTALINWFTWWIGDSFGAAMVVPMILAFYGKPAALWRPRRLSLCIPASSLIVVLLYLNSKTAEWQSAHARSLLRFQSQQLVHDIEHNLILQSLLMQASEVQLKRSDRMNETDFQDLLQSLQNGRNALQSLRVTKGGQGFEPSVHFQWNAFKGPVDPFRRQGQEQQLPGERSEAKLFAPTDQQLMARILVRSHSSQGEFMQLLAVFDFTTDIKQSLVSIGSREVLFSFQKAQNNPMERIERYALVPGLRWHTQVPDGQNQLQMVLILPFSAMLSHPRNEYFFALLFGLILALTLFCILLVASGQSYRFERLFIARSQELKEQQLKAEHSAKMAALGSMAGSIAHEINNPLAIIHGYSKFLLQKIADNRLSQAELTNGLCRIDETSLRISEIIKALRSYARDDLQDELMDCSAVEIINETIHLCLELLKNRQVSLTWNEAYNHGIRFKGRKAALMQVLLNLINNACDAIIGEPEKWIRIDMDVLEEKGLIQIRVTDSGRGIPQEIREKIMKPFFSTKTYGVGTGLGLSISKNLVESMGGALILDGNASNTSFLLSLPRSDIVC